LAGKAYHAELDESGFSVIGDVCSWRVLWTEARLKGEDKRVFMFGVSEVLIIVLWLGSALRPLRTTCKGLLKKRIPFLREWIDFDDPTIYF
jgi:hypothetical protein